VPPHHHGMAVQDEVLVRLAGSQISPPTPDTLIDMLERLVRVRVDEALANRMRPVCLRLSEESDTKLRRRPPEP
jgi:hypothetical protein